MKTICELLGKHAIGEWQDLGGGVYRVICPECGVAGIITIPEVRQDIIEALNEEQTIGLTICDIRNHSPESEIIVIDNKSTDGSFERLNDLSDIKLIQTDYNCGFPRANNIALKNAQGQYFILLNNDTELLNDALSIMVEFMKEHHDSLYVQWIMGE